MKCGNYSSSTGIFYNAIDNVSIGNGIYQKVKVNKYIILSIYIKCIYHYYTRYWHSLKSVESMKFQIVRIKLIFWKKKQSDKYFKKP